MQTQLDNEDLRTPLHLKRVQNDEYLKGKMDGARSLEEMFAVLDAAEESEAINVTTLLEDYARRD